MCEGSMNDVYGVNYPCLCAYQGKERDGDCEVEEIQLKMQEGGIVSVTVYILNKITLQEGTSKVTTEKESLPYDQEA